MLKYRYSYSCFLLFPDEDFKVAINTLHVIFWHFNQVLFCSILFMKNNEWICRGHASLIELTLVTFWFSVFILDIIWHFFYQIKSFYNFALNEIFDIFQIWTIWTFLLDELDFLQIKGSLTKPKNYICLKFIIK